MKILVTGCAGFIGANFVEYWLDSHPDDTVIGVDSLTYAANIPVLNEVKKRDNFVFYKNNICHVSAMNDVFKSETPDVVVNFAAESHVDRSIEASRIFVETNVLGVQTLLDMCLKYSVGRFHQISTDEVYGDLPLESNERFTENTLLNPSSPYSASKAAADMLVLSYYKTHGLPVSISRCSNNYGKYQHTEKLIPKVVSYALENELFPIYGSGENVREWINVLDHCRAVDLILKNAKPGGVYNVGGDVVISNIKLVKMIYGYLNKPDNMITFAQDRKGHDRKYALDCNKLRSELGWSPTVCFSKGLEETISWYKKIGNFKI